MTLRKLSARQDEILTFVRDRIVAGESPLRSEIAKHFKFHVNAAECHLRSLQRRGFIKLLRRKRGIEWAAP